jgi:hypothetical protein
MSVGENTSDESKQNTSGGSSGATVCADCAAELSFLESGDTFTALPSAKRKQRARKSVDACTTSEITYWSEMAKVYRSVHQAMKPGGVMACVVKDYISKGQRVPLCDDTCRLLESLGFEVFERTRAWLVKSESHPGLFGEEVKKTKSRKSFFRRLAEKNGSPEINWEEVIWCRR